MRWADGSTQGESLDLVRALDAKFPESPPLWPPEGVPIGCDHDSSTFQAAFQGTKALTVAIVMGFALIGQKTMGFSIAMMGATMIITGGLDLLKVIMTKFVDDQELLVTITETFTSVELPVTYGVGGLGYLFQWMILKQKDDIRYTSPEYEVEDTADITELKEKLKTQDPEKQTVRAP